MTKKIIIIFILTILVIFISYSVFFNKKTVINKTNTLISPTSNYLISGTIGPTKSVISNSSNDYQLNYLIVRPTDIIELYSNLKEKLTSFDAKNKYGCSNLISGGFYDTNNKHLGLFYAQSELIQNTIESELFNGFFLIDKSKNTTITKNSPASFENLRIALQSGPILYALNKPVSINSTSTDMARRVIAAISNRNEIIFISLHTKNNPILGPTLSEIPSIIKKINQSTSLNINDAINLDGGAHSAFITDQANLSELGTIGGFFCIKRN